MESYLMYCVVDTSLIIDLYVGNIIVEFFRLSYDFVAPDFIIDELQEPDSKILLECGLRQHAHRLMRVKGSRFPEDESEKRFQAWLNE